MRTRSIRFVSSSSVHVHVCMCMSICVCPYVCVCDDKEPNRFLSSVPSSKQVSTAALALSQSGLKDGSTLLVGGFGLSGIPMALIKAVQLSKFKDLVVVRWVCWCWN